MEINSANRNFWFYIFAETRILISKFKSLASHAYLSFCLPLQLSGFLTDIATGVCLCFIPPLHWYTSHLISDDPPGETFNVFRLISETRVAKGFWAFPRGWSIFQRGVWCFSRLHLQWTIKRHVLVLKFLIQWQFHCSYIPQAPLAYVAKEDIWVQGTISAPIASWPSP